jgi:hypothetical protein
MYKIITDDRFAAQVMYAKQDLSSFMIDPAINIVRFVAFPGHLFDQFFLILGTHDGRRMPCRGTYSTHRGKTARDSRTIGR